MIVLRGSLMIARDQSRASFLAFVRRRDASAELRVRDAGIADDPMSARPPIMTLSRGVS